MRWYIYLPLLGLALLASPLVTAAAASLTFRWLDRPVAAAPRPAAAEAAAPVHPAEQAAARLVSGDRLRLAAARLLGLDGEKAHVYLWVDQDDARVHYRVTLRREEQRWRPMGLEGPFAPLLGYRPAPLPLAGAVLFAPRRPEPGLYALLAEVSRHAPVVLAQDARVSNRTLRQAREAGWQGQVMLVKGRLEEQGAGAYLGAVGLLVDRGGRAVAPLSALDPSRYPIPVEPAGILRAWNVSP